MPNVVGQRVCVVVPAYNEAAVIRSVVEEILTLGFLVVVVDDGSDDETSQVCLSLPVGVLRHCCNLGQGAALATGIAYALRELDVDYLVTCDADGQHKASDVRALVQAVCAGDVDVALGTRFARAGDAAAVPRRRRDLLRAAALYTRLTTGLSVTDAHNGLRAFTAAAACRREPHRRVARHGALRMTTVCA